jgi:hypothetical protein
VHKRNLTLVFNGEAYFQFVKKVAATLLRTEHHRHSHCIKATAICSFVAAAKRNATP